MFSIIVYKPEQAHKDPNNPLAGVELLGFADTIDGADEMIHENAKEHPDWQFKIEQIWGN